MVRNRSLAMAGLLALALAGPAAAQVQPWQYRWYWGGKGGLQLYSLPTVGNVRHPAAGGEWMITGRRAALYVGYSTTFAQEGDNFSFSTVQGTTVPVVWNGFQRIQLALLVFPTNGPIQPYAGGGFVIETLGNVQVDPTNSLSQPQFLAASRFIQAHGSGGFALVMGGLQIRLGKAAIFGQAQLSPQGRDFILPNSATTLEFGVRYAFLGSREDDVTTRR
jgi:hypothetical protein